MPHIKQYYEGDDGWSDWAQPEMDQDYRLVCCDCGLAHDMQFRVMEIVEDLGNGYKDVTEADTDKFLVHFRAKRNNRSTAQIRRRDNR